MKIFDFKLDPITGEEYYEVNVGGRQLLNSHILNKGPSFTREERVEFDLMGCLPWGIEDLQGQVDRALEMYRRKDEDLERYIFLMELQNRNATVFYRLLLDNLVEMIPIVYTPTVGQACMQMSHIQRRARGIYIHPDNLAAIDRIFGNISLPDVRLIVVTDGERILGLGDLGADGMGISIGKVCLYVAAGCLHPAVCMPMCIDVGTNNERLLNDPLYLGWRHPRLQGDAYYDFIEQFVVAVRRNFPSALLQWEDFAKHHAFDLLARYRERILSFNDDIQGTGATGLAALMTAARIKGVAMKDMRYAIVGMGEAGSGISDNIRAAMVGEGLSDAEARRRIFPMDKQGLLLDDDPTLEPQQRPYALPRAVIEGWTLDNPSRVELMDVLRNAKPNVLIGVTARPGLFDDAVLAQMAANDPRPVIMPLSNPTSKVECVPEAVSKATQGRFLMATGSPFAPVEAADGLQGIAQCNNLFIFPGVGLGAIISGSPKVTDAMFAAGANALSSMVTPEQKAQGYLLPKMENIREASAQVAMAVAREARDSGLGRRLDDSAIERIVRHAQWNPRFYPYRKPFCATR